MSFRKLVRFASNGETFYGDLLTRNGNTYSVKKLRGTPFDGLEPTGETLVADKLLYPLESTPIIQCIGLNYQKHATEAKLPVPKYPVVFTKPADALAGPFDDIPIPQDAQPQLDYEGELCVVIGRDCKNVKEENALDYVLGYTIGNDVSARNFQLPEASGGQYCYAKSFDRFAPIGPEIWSKELVPDPQALSYKTLVNGEVLQKTRTDDMIWSVRQLVSHLSRGITLRRGTLIMTGTPSGVGFFRNRFLKDGDVVTVEVEGFDGIANRMVFEKEKL